MTASGDLFAATKVLHYVAPFAIIGYFSVSSLWSVIALQPRDGTLRKRLRRGIITLMALIVASFVAESALIIYQIFSTDSVFGTQDSNVYTLSGILVWTLLLGSKVDSDKHEWYPYYGAWALAFAFELTTFVLRICSHEPETPIESTQLALQLARVLSELLLLGVYLVRSGSLTPATDEETTPLLSQPDGEEAGRPKRDDSQPVTEENAVSDALEREEAKRDKKRKEKHAMLETRLHEHSNWFTYLSEYMIFFPYIWPTNNPKLLWNMGGVALCLVAQRVLNVLGPRQLGILTNSLNAGMASESFTALILYVLFNLLKSQAGVSGIQRVLWVRVERNARMCLDMASYNKIMELSCDFHDEKQTGELFTQMRQGTSLVDLLETCVYEIGPLATDLLVAFFYFYILFDSYLVLIAAATVIAYFWTSLIFTALQVRYRRKHVIRMRRKYQYQHDTVSSWRTVTYFNKIPHVEKMYATSVDKSMDTWTTLTNLYNVGSAAKGLVLDVGRFAALMFAVYQVVYNGKDVGSFMTLLTYWSQFSSPLQTLASMQRQMLDDLVDAEELRGLFQRKPTVPDGPKEMYVDKAEVEFENVSFAYNEGKDVIDGLSFLVEAGKKVAIIGETGAGKSTVLKLLFRLYDTTKGSIRIDGQDIKGTTLSSLREDVGVVPQDPSLFNDTIISNLRFGKLDITLDEAIEACKAAAIHDQIMKFPDGYNSVVGERGVKLSGGERQRIAIARAILKQPKLILLDEATSSVDNETEEKIQEGLAKLCEGRTTIVIAHRLSTIMDSDLILVIKDGKILEQGTPKDLLRQKGKYYSLWSKQVGIVDAMNEIEEESKKLIETSSLLSEEQSKAPSNTDGAADVYEKTGYNNSSSDTAADDEPNSESTDNETKDSQENARALQSQASELDTSNVASEHTAGNIPPKTDNSNGRSSNFTLRFNYPPTSLHFQRHGASSFDRKKLRAEAPEFVPNTARPAMMVAQVPQTPPPRVRLPPPDNCGVVVRQVSGGGDCCNASASMQDSVVFNVFQSSSENNIEEHYDSAQKISANNNQKTGHRPEPDTSDVSHKNVAAAPSYRRPHLNSRRGISRSDPSGPCSVDETAHSPPSNKSYFTGSYGPGAAKGGGNSQGRCFSSASTMQNNTNYGSTNRRPRKHWRQNREDNRSSQESCRTSSGEVGWKHDEPRLKAPMPTPTSGSTANSSPSLIPTTTTKTGTSHLTVRFAPGI